MTDPIPDASYSALFSFVEDSTRVSAETTIRAVAAPLVAAELRRLVAEYGGLTARGDFIIDAEVLTDLADQLAPVELDAADGLPVDQRRTT